MRLRFDCAFYYVADLDRSVQFYTSVLGLTLSSRDTVARLHVDGILLELVPTSDTSLLTGSGNARLTFAVDHIEQVANDLETRGVRVSRVRRVHNGFLAFFRDPDGNELALWQYADAADVIHEAGGRAPR